MVNVNDVVTYGVNGICRIVEIEEKIIMGESKNYFVLKPLDGGRSTYYVPVDNEELLGKLHKILSEEEINSLIDSIPNEMTIWIENERERKESYKKIISDGNHSDLIRMIKTIYFHKKEREKEGKKLHMSDERFLKEAEKILYGEFGYVLNLSGDELVSYVVKRVNTEGQ